MERNYDSRQKGESKHGEGSKGKDTTVRLDWNDKLLRKQLETIGEGLKKASEADHVRTVTTLRSSHDLTLGKSVESNCNKKTNKFNDDKKENEMKKVEQHVSRAC